MKKSILGVAGAVLAGGLVLAGALPASAAYTSTVRTCETLTVDLRDYPAGPSTVSVSFDGAEPTVYNFDTTFRASFAYDDLVGGSAAPHSYRIVIDAPGTRFDKVKADSSRGCKGS